MLLFEFQPCFLRRKDSPQNQTVRLTNLLLTRTYHNVNQGREIFHLWGANNLPEVDVHPRVAVDQMPVVRLTILQLHELRSQKFSTVRTNNRLNEESHAKNNDERRSQTPGAYHGVPLGGLEKREGKLHKNKKKSNQTRPPTTSQFWGSRCKRREGGRTILYGIRG